MLVAPAPQAPSCTAHRQAPAFPIAGFSTSRPPRSDTLLLPMRIPAIALALVAATVIVSGRQAPADPKLQAQLKQVFPAATAFSPKGGDPPHYKAYVSDAAGAQTLV